MSRGMNVLGVVVFGGLVAGVGIPTVEGRTAHDTSIDSSIGQVAIGLEPKLVVEWHSLRDTDGSWRFPVAVDLRNFGTNNNAAGDWSVLDEPAAASEDKPYADTKVDIKSAAFQKQVGIAIEKSAEQFNGTGYRFGAAHSNPQPGLKKWDASSKQERLKNFKFDCSGYVSWAIQDLGKSSKTWTVATIRSDKRNYMAVSRDKAMVGDLAVRGTHHVEIVRGKETSKALPTTGAHMPSLKNGHLNSKKWDNTVYRYIGYLNYDGQEHLNVFVQNVQAMNQTQ